LGPRMSGWLCAGVAPPVRSNYEFPGASRVPRISSCLAPRPRRSRTDLSASAAARSPQGSGDLDHGDVVHLDRHISPEDRYLSLKTSLSSLQGGKYPSKKVQVTTNPPAGGSLTRNFAAFSPPLPGIEVARPWAPFAARSERAGLRKGSGISASARTAVMGSPRAKSESVSPPWTLRPARSPPSPATREQCRHHPPQ